jgi:bisphosphoglycerate-dependent phosphoglycerate mutase
MARKSRRLYREGAHGTEEREFEDRYGEHKGERVYGAVVGKVAREQAAERGGKKVERIRRHPATSSQGKPYIVRAHEAEVTADPEDDRPRRGSSEHEVEPHEETVRGRRYPVRGHLAKNPNR